MSEVPPFFVVARTRLGRTTAKTLRQPETITCPNPEPSTLNPETPSIQHPSSIIQRSTPNPQQTSNLKPDTGTPWRRRRSTKGLQRLNGQ